MDLGEQTTLLRGMLTSPIRLFRDLCKPSLPRGGHPEMAHDPRNVNILCKEHHTIWENQTGRATMRIYLSNLQRIDDLTNEYKNLP